MYPIEEVLYPLREIILNGGYGAYLRQLVETSRIIQDYIVSIQEITVTANIFLFSLIGSLIALLLVLLIAISWKR